MRGLGAFVCLMSQSVHVQLCADNALCLELTLGLKSNIKDRHPPVRAVSPLAPLMLPEGGAALGAVFSTERIRQSGRGFENALC